MSVFASQSPGFRDELLLCDSTPVPCGASRETAKRSALGEVAGYGYCRSHSRWYWGLRLRLLAAPDGTPRALTLADGQLDCFTCGSLAMREYSTTDTVSQEHPCTVASRKPPGVICAFRRSKARRGSVEVANPTDLDDRIDTPQQRGYATDWGHKRERRVNPNYFCCPGRQYGPSSCPESDAP